MLFQGGALFDSLTVWQNVAFRLRHARKPMPRAEARELAIAKLARVGLGPETADLFPAELSGGMQKRVGLARAIATEPEIIFFDEPTAGLDPILAGVINDLIREMRAGDGRHRHHHHPRHDDRPHRRRPRRHAPRRRRPLGGPVDDMETAGDPYLDQFIHGRAEGPIAAVR